MKKKILMFLLVAMLGSSVFAGEITTNISILGLFGSNTELSSDSEAKMSEAGIDISMMNFFNGNKIGFYINTGYGFFTDVTIKDSVGGYSITIDGKYIEHGMDLSAVLGLAFQKKFNNNFAIASGIGLQFNQISLVTHEEVGGNSMINYSLGLGGEIGVKYFITPKFYLTGAWNLAFTPINFGSKIDGVETENEAAYFSSRVFIGIGFRFAEYLR